jgi:predicted permease
MFMNAGNYGLPAARFAFGQEGFDRAVLFFVVQAILAQTLAIYIAGAGHGDRRGGLVRLLRMPQIYAVLAVGLSYLLNLDELSTKLAVMLSSMPTAVNVTILAIEFNVHPRCVSSAVVVSTAASVFSLTLILVLLGVG